MQDEKSLGLSLFPARIYMKKILCRKGCGACCIAPTISSPLPGMPDGKSAGVRCIHLTEDNQCNIYESPERPKVCKSFQATEELCGRCTREALELIARLETVTIGPMGP